MRFKIVTLVDYGFDLESVTSFVTKRRFCVLIYSEAMYIFSCTDALHANIFSPFIIWK